MLIKHRRFYNVVWVSFTLFTVRNFCTVTV